jgi:hypothetical protein
VTPPAATVAARSGRAAAARPTRAAAAAGPVTKAGPRAAARRAGARSGAARKLPERRVGRARARAVAWVLPIARPRAARLLDALLYGRAWIGLVAILLAGIVFFNVGLLQRGREIARTDERALELRRENAKMRLRLARAGSSERIQQAAARVGLVLPQPGEVRYLRARPSADARLAARRIRAPFEATAAPGPAPSGLSSPARLTGAPPTGAVPAPPAAAQPAAAPAPPPAAPAPPPAAPAPVLTP